MALFFLPVVLFAGAWRRMSKAGSPGKMRPLGMSIGLLIYIAIRFTFLLLEFPFLDPGYGLVVVGFAVLWLSITGRLDRM
jgi:Na+/proline symporter